MAFASNAKREFSLGFLLFYFFPIFDFISAVCGSWLRDWTLIRLYWLIVKTVQLVTIPNTGVRFNAILATNSVLNKVQRGIAQALHVLRGRVRSGDPAGACGNLQDPRLLRSECESPCGRSPKSTFIYLFPKPFCVVVKHKRRMLCAWMTQPIRRSSRCTTRRTDIFSSQREKVATPTAGVINLVFFRRQRKGCTLGDRNDHKKCVPIKWISCFSEERSLYGSAKKGVISATNFGTTNRILLPQREILLQAPEGCN